ncbi:biopolymer transporter ExbD [Pseudanabaena sp. FACHB-1998]|uniref:ExbD/TolR family protein n=1 Tax=Pseudanabaena sp. FACHB-1998 TaxID=2692858 RepID=UPI0016815911|nr:biopolymer transporter ExbD [Pseudanabaena sp. FACHB-1998]MBD2178747.1 biopolymer transporter ExbD [Pseudanabaena sp. FACHB-1998]
MKVRKKYQASSNAEINLTALLDVVFSILAFFILLSAALTIPSRIGVDLPVIARGNSSGNSGTSDLKQEDLFVITLDPSGQMLVNGKVLTPQQLEQDIRKFLETSAQGIVVLSADNTNVSYQQVINRLAEIRAIAGNRVAIATSRS